MLCVLRLTSLRMLNADKLTAATLVSGAEHSEADWPVFPARLQAQSITRPSVPPARTEEIPNDACEGNTFCMREVPVDLHLHESPASCQLRRTDGEMSCRAGVMIFKRQSLESWAEPSALAGDVLSAAP